MRTFVVAFIGGIVGTVFASVIAFAWTGPTSTPPNGNVAAPLNVGTTDQIKNAGLGLNSLAVFGNAILAGVSSYLNFGTTAGSNGYGIRDNSGTMEFKNGEGTWQSILSPSSTFSQIKFADGTTQMTAAPSAAVAFVAAMQQIGITIPLPPGLAAWPNQIICRASGGAATWEMLVPLNTCTDQSCSQVWALKQDGIYVAIDTATGAFTVARFNPTCGAPQATIQSVCNAGRCVF